MRLNYLIQVSLIWRVHVLREMSEILEMDLFWCAIFLSLLQDYIEDTEGKSYLGKVILQIL